MSLAADLAERLIERHGLPHDLRVIRIVKAVELPKNVPPPWEWFGVSEEHPSLIIGSRNTIAECVFAHGLDHVKDPETGVITVEVTEAC